MGKKTIWAICAFNIIASGFAVAWVTKPYWRSKPASKFDVSSSQVTPPAAPKKNADELWREFTQADTYDAALRALVALPADADRRARLSTYLMLTRLPTPALAPDSSLTEAVRRAAGIAIWAEHVEIDSPEAASLQALALDRSQTTLERENALRGIMLAAQRRHKADAHDDIASWRETLAAYLLNNDFGRGSSVEGLALQAMAFALSEKLAPLDRSTVLERVGLLLDTRNGASEAVLIAALDVAHQLGGTALLNHARLLAQRPPSDACTQAALNFLAQHGTAEDAAWLNNYTPTSSALQLAAGNARFALLHRLANPPPAPLPAPPSATAAATEETVATAAR